MESSGYAAPAAGIGIQSFLQRVFMWMFAALLVSGAVAAAIGSSDSLVTSITEDPTIVIVVIVVQLALAFGLIFGIRKMSPGVALGLFFVYAATIGVTFAMIFEFYTKQSIFTAFVVTAGMFGAMALIGYTTKADLSKLGTVLIAALIALILATVVNLFVANSTLYWVTTYAGVVIFAGLTAYDMQKLKRIGEQGLEGATAGRLEVFGAFTLYLDFINMFLFLLRIFGKSR